jgi:hypothetical protein
MGLHPKPGKHHLMAMDEDGNKAITYFEILGDIKK